MVIKRSLTAVGAAVVVALVTATACQSPGSVDKAGSGTIVVRLATIDKVNDNGQSFGPQAFVDELAKVSGGHIKVQVVNDFHFSDPAAESQLVKAIAAGEIDGGWPGTRAFARAGIDSLQAVEAPMLITSYAAEKAVVSGPVAAKLLDTLKGSAVIGLGLAVGPLRRPFAAKAPLLSAHDWNGVRFRVFNSPVQAAAVEDLGATPVNASIDWINKVMQGSLGGGEFDVAQYARNGLTTQIGNVTGNVILWPKMLVLSFSKKRFDSLTDQQRSWVRQAAAKAVQASVDARYDDAGLAQRLCAQGATFPQASDAQIAGLRVAFQPTIDRLAADPVNGPLLRDLQGIAAKYPATDVVAATGCHPDSQNGAVGAIPAAVSALPPGTYRVELSEDDLRRGGLSNGDGITGIWTLKVRRGTYQVSCHPLDLPGTDCGHEVYNGPLDVGDLRGTGHVAYFVYRADRLAKLTGCQLPPAFDESGHCFAGQPYGATWHVDGSTLTFSHYVGGAPTSDNYTVKPWTKIS